MAGNLTNEQRKWILKQNWKTKKCDRVRKQRFWESVKDKVFTRRPCTVENMSQFILEACQEIDANKVLCSRVCVSVRPRLEECVNADGKQFEYLRN